MYFFFALLLILISLQFYCQLRIRKFKFEFASSSSGVFTSYQRYEVLQFCTLGARMLKNDFCAQNALWRLEASITTPPTRRKLKVAHVFFDNFHINDYLMQNHILYFQKYSKVATRQSFRNN